MRSQEHTPTGCDGTKEYWHTKHDGSWWAIDARGIPLKRVCEKCYKAKLAEFRPEVLSDPNYDHCEPIKGE